MFWVYVIRSITTGKYYIGHTSNLKQRIEAHNVGKNLSTKKRRPYKLVYKEQLTTRREAAIRESKIKSYKGGNAFRKLLNG